MELIATQRDATQRFPTKAIPMIEKIHPLHNAIDPTGTRSIPNVRPETKLLVAFLRGRVGQTIPYKQYGEDLIGRSAKPGSIGYRYLSSARRILLRDHGIVIDAEPKVGIRVCTPEEKVDVMAHHFGKSRRQLKHSRHIGTATEYDELSDTKKKKWNTYMTVITTTELFTTPAAVRKIEAVVTDRVLPSAKILDLFKR
jgi:hypothetical protein